MSTALVRSKLLAHLAAADGRGLLLREMVPRQALPSEIDAARAELEAWRQAAIVRFSGQTDRYYLLDYQRALRSVTVSADERVVPLRPNVRRATTLSDRIVEVVRRRRVLSVQELHDELPDAPSLVVNAMAAKLVSKGNLARLRRGVLSVPSIAQERRP